MKTIEILQNELKGLKEQFEVVWFGSRVTGGFRPQSDYDLAVITRNSDEQANIQFQLDVLKYADRELDVRIFELFPIYIQMSIINHYKVIFGDPVAISAYFYQFRKKWEDCKHRILMH